MALQMADKFIEQMNYPHMKTQVRLLKAAHVKHRKPVKRLSLL